MTQLQKVQAQVNDLNQFNVATLPATIDVPTYDRSKVKAGIVHIGVGGFHRAHQAAYINELLKQPGNEQWGICGVGLLEANRGLRDVLQKQDNLYTVTIRHPNGQIDNTVIGSMVEFLFALDDKQAVIEKMAHSDTKIVSLTITEGGYNFHPSTGEFDYTNPDIMHDIANPNDPITAFGYLTAALKQRKEAGLPAFTVQSCDNIQHNGHVTRKMLLAFADKQDVELANWIKQNVAFPNAMVDRITPISKQSDIDYVVQAYGVADGWPITCESFAQWVIEDNFSNGRPNLENVGAQLVKDVTPYEKMKIRLLNAGHSVLGLLGSIHGYSTIDETVSDPLFAKYLRSFMDLEVSHLLEQLDGIDLEQYKDTLLDRFSNPNIKDSLTRICSESSAKLPKFLIASINENLALNRDVSLATLVVAAWCLYSDKGVDEQGQALEIQDVMAKELKQFAQKTANNTLSFIELNSIFGYLPQSQQFVDGYTKAIKALYEPNSKISHLMAATLETKEH
ncbi:mannitol dehydrogenase family protein [Psychrosphaera sp. B3R10]|uniref:mannitol dehydrogenase family protein n=1 Tax=unclassified Psychrosphaera TaxID=2641570 RepID=UPI001C08E896|nr:MULTISPECIES: mannitol dehydrogenase family protein [unclassified Psychrosphaera]MBU2881305.1 mannitol dehydrogenase family protein [Psychrosphaera sp. I2R16]MBU2988404.1 mannitol dehydrogenase family protein [Psychrosphaera sp. B3R10]MDO6720096.1 mannitol dehydrogenase family protein [Psychrosphaera sp. 1_MG-2023]